MFGEEDFCGNRRIGFEMLIDILILVVDLSVSVAFRKIV